MVQMYETGARPNPGLSVLQRFAQALGCTVAYFAGESCSSAPAWRDLEEAWPEIGDAVILCRDNGIGGYDYQAAVCVGSKDDRFPFTDAGDDIHIEDWDSCRWWLPFRPKD